MRDVELHHGDCLDILKTMPDNSVDSIVTDPPYGLSFMGRKWDYDVPSVEVWAECLRVLKPGGHLLAFAGTRTQHRMAVRIEDAGFEIRDLIMWCYGSGFPKSLDVSKQIDRVNGEAGRLHKFTAWMRTTGLTCKQINDATGTFMGSHYLTDKSQPAIPTPVLWARLRPLCGKVPAWVDELVERIEAERQVIGQDTKARSTAGASALPTIGGDTVYKSWDITAPATEAARQWQGWGTALKPALEPITMARKPFAGTVAANVLEHGTGALNIDGCRVPTGDDLNGGRYSDNKRGDDGNSYGNGINLRSAKEYQQPTGRWPANLIHDGSEEVLAGFPATGPAKASMRGIGLTGADEKVYGKGNPDFDTVRGHNDNGGSAARFFYCAKASKRDREDGLQHMIDVARANGNKWTDQDYRVANGEIGGGRESGPRKNHHPTVKPTDLMRYLLRLVTPPGGVALDPFMGSGSTGKAAILEGFGFIGIEREAEYLAIARARIATQATPGPLFT